MDSKKFTAGAVLVSAILLLISSSGTCLTLGEDNLGVYLDLNYCTDYYPYTYSKCLKICSDSLESTCLDDQLCFCDTRLQQASTSKSTNNLKMWKLPHFGGILPVHQEMYGVKPTSKCQSHQFCKETCISTASVSGLRFKSGILCKAGPDENVKACVCSI